MKYNVKIGIFIACFFVLVAHAQKSPEAHRSAQSSVVSRYIQATQHRDFKTLIDLTYAYQADVASIKAQNPQVLWPKLIGDYYQNKTLNLSQDPGVWGNFIQGAMADVGDPTQSIRALQVLISRPCNWNITETRQGQVRFPLGPVVPVTMTYITVSYPTATDAPIAPRRLKQVILNFNVGTASGLVVSIQRLSAGDVYWPIPRLTKETAREVAMKQLDDTALYFHVSLPLVSADSTDEQPWVKAPAPREGPLLSKYQEVFQRSGFQTRPDPNPRWWHVQLPASWAKYRLTGQNRQTPGRRSYKVDEITEVEILDLAGNQESGSAKAKLRLVHSGCTDVCKLVRDLYTTPEFVACEGCNDEPFRVWGNNSWGLFHGDGGNWPQWEGGSVDYKWDETKLRWTIPVSNYITDATAGPPISAPVVRSQSSEAANVPEIRTTSMTPGNSVVGHYVNGQHNDEYLDLESNGAFRWRVGGQDLAGSYQISEGVLTLIFPPVGATARGKLAGGRFNCCLSNGLDPMRAGLIDDESKNWVTQGGIQSVSTSSSESAQTSFSVRHRHSTFFNLQTSQAQSFCSGMLSVWPDGTVKYDCEQTEDPSGRCDHLSFSPGSLTQVKIGLDGSLHLATKTQGKFDFYGDSNSINQAQAAISPLIQK